jgi:xylulokinase
VTARVLGVDIGTTAVKAIALDEHGRVAATASIPHDGLAPRPGWSEGDPDAWWQGAVRALRRLAEQGPLDAVAMVGVSGMVPALLCLDGAGRVLRPSIQQNDARTEAEIEWLRGGLPAADFFAATGQPLSQQLVLPRLLWLRTHEPEVHRRIRRVLGSYDWITHRLTGEWSLERNWALESGFWDARHRGWYAPALAATETPEAWLPPVRAPHEVVGALTPEAAAATGLRAGTRVIAGSADHVAAALAAGTGPGELVLKIGGGGDVLYGVDHFAPDPHLYIDYHDLPGRFLLNGCMVASGALVKWFAEAFAGDLGEGEARYARLDAEAEVTPPGADGLVMLPYFLGEKTPIFDPGARGAVTGLALAHSRGHLFRAVLEAVAYGFRHHVDVLVEGGHPIRVVRVMDRGARSPLWRQIVADVLGHPIEYAPGADLGSAWGVAWVAGVAAGCWDWERSGTGARSADPPPVVHAPVPEHTARYERLYRIYRGLYPALRGETR